MAMDLLSTYLVVGGRIIMMKIIPSIKLPIIKNGDPSNNINKIITHLNYLLFLPFLLILTTDFPFAIVDFRDYSSLLLY